MNTFLALNNGFAMMQTAAKNLLDTLAAEQISLEAYKLKDKANSLVIEARQNRINLQYDNLDIILDLIDNLPLIIEQRIIEVKAKAESEQNAKKCPVCFPPSVFYPYNSESEKEAIRARSILEAKLKYNY